ncbi:MAG: M15 family metallopeptidase [Candidatus Saccharibacteria bacterium]|nr:M15 family metallopeptidase [Candidatus Saccharibacteria bacterium]
MSKNEPLVPITTKADILVEPIWNYPIDDFEGPLYLEYISKNPTYTNILVRETVAKKLQRAAKNVPEKYQLILRAGHRPIEVQYKLLEMVKQSYIQDNPHASGAESLAFARKYVADPSIKLPPHCCGAAIDMDMIDTTTGQLVDFGCPMNTDGEIAHVYSEQISASQANNREILREALLDAGFAPNPNEWWHFSYGDQNWVNFYDKPNAIYGLIEPEL